MDTTGTDRAVLTGVSMGAGYALRLAAERPDRVLGCIFIGPTVGLSDPIPGRVTYGFEDVLDTEEEWAKYNAHYWRRDWPGFAEFFFGQVFSEPHSTKQIEDCVAWATDTDAETILIAEDAPYLGAPASKRRRPSERPFALDLADAVRCPSLVIHGSGDRISHVTGGRRLAEALEASLIELESSGHCPQVREPVETNLLIRRFVESLSSSLPPRPGPVRLDACARSPAPRAVPLLADRPRPRATRHRGRRGAAEAASRRPYRLVDASIR